MKSPYNCVFCFYDKTSAGERTRSPSGDRQRRCQARDPCRVPRPLDARLRPEPMNHSGEPSFNTRNGPPIRQRPVPGPCCSCRNRIRAGRHRRAGHVRHRRSVHLGGPVRMGPVAYESRLARGSRSSATPGTLPGRAGTAPAPRSSRPTCWPANWPPAATTAPRSLVRAAAAPLRRARPEAGPRRQGFPRPGDREEDPPARPVLLPAASPAESQGAHQVFLRPDRERDQAA